MGLAFFVAFAYLFLIKAPHFVQLQARFYRIQYKIRLRMPDEKIDRRVAPLWFMFMIDSMSHFVNRGPEHPEEFPRLVIYYRLIGCLVWVLIIVVTSIVVWGAITGRLMIGPSVR